MPSLPFTPVFLWTDILIYLLLSVVIYSVLYVRKHAHLIAPWKLVIKRKRGVISIMVLLCYVFVGLLDSIHFRLAIDGQQKSEQQHYETQVTSVLDLAIMPLRKQVEKTYSAPFATRSFSREMQKDVSSELSYVYPKLHHGGAHLESEKQKLQDILSTIITSSVKALITWLLLSALLINYLAKRYENLWFKQYKDIVLGSARYPVRTILLMLGIILLTVFNIAALSVDYHVLGTDKVGQDVLYQSLKSIRTGLVIGTLTTLVMLPLAISMGIAAGYFSVGETFTAQWPPRGQFAAASEKLLQLWRNKSYVCCVNCGRTLSIHRWNSAFDFVVVPREMVRMGEIPKAWTTCDGGSI